MIIVSEVYIEHMQYSRDVKLLDQINVACSQLTLSSREFALTFTDYYIDMMVHAYISESILYTCIEIAAFVYTNSTTKINIINIKIAIMMSC